MVTIDKAFSDDDYLQIESLARIIWHEHYFDILSQEQIGFMLAEFQSFAAIKKSVVSDGYEYYLIKGQSDKRPQGLTYDGYLSIRREEDCLFLSKLYVGKWARGLGLGKLLMDKALCEAKGKRFMYLTVNKLNRSQEFYIKQGFVVKKDAKTHIGKNFFMDDFIMYKELLD